jgi:hypothetical protein
MSNQKALLLAITFLLAGECFGQIGIFKKEDKQEDTLYHMFLDTVTIEARNLRNYNYNRYQYVVRKVYPLADSAVALFNQVNAKTSDMGRRESKKYRKQLEKDLKENFEDRLKKMSRTEGLVLIKIIERNTGLSLYELLKDVKNSSTAWWWQNLGRLYGYNLKEGYSADNNPMLENIIQEYEKERGIKPYKPTTK